MVLTLGIPGTFNSRIAAADALGRPWLFRSAALDALSPDGRNTLSELGIRRIVDLREHSERGTAPPPASSPVHSAEVLTIPLYRLPGGPPTQGSIRSVYRFLLRERAERVARAVEAVAASPGPALVHCSYGKDRTGLIVALTLLAAGRPLDEVLADYALSAAQMPAARRTEVLHQLAAENVDDEAAEASLELHLASPPGQLEEIIGELHAEDGGITGYLLRAGLPRTALEQLQEKDGRR